MKFTTLESVRTNNINDSEMPVKIRATWDSASTQFDADTHGVYGVYHEYENNYKGDYTFSVCTVKEGVVCSIVTPDDQKYQHFDVEGYGPDSVVATWQKIWQLEEDGELDRAYTVDYEVYEDHGIAIYIAIK